MTIGFGFAPAGMSPAGIGLPVSSPALVAKGYQTSTTGAVSSVNIDPKTLDQTVDANGSDEGMSDTAQRVYFCLRTLQGAISNLPGFGLEHPKAASPDILPAVREMVRVAMAPVLDDGSATLDDVQIEVAGTSVFSLIKWTDVKRAKKLDTRARIGS